MNQQTDMTRIEQIVHLIEDLISDNVYIDTYENVQIEKSAMETITQTLKNYGDAVRDQSYKQGVHDEQQRILGLPCMEIERRAMLPTTARAEYSNHNKDARNELRRKIFKDVYSLNHNQEEND